MITGKLYDRLKFLALIVFPALASAYFALAGIWGLPAVEQVVGTIVVVDTFLGALLQISSQQYAKSDARFDGQMMVSQTPTGKVFSLELEGDPEKLRNQQEVRFKVQEVKKP